jgi:hypothetical protein
MSKETFEKNIGELITTIDYCLNSKWNLPSLILIYSGIDILAWLNLPSNREKNTKADFIKWATNYLLPNSKLKCTADDLYGARCSLVHTYTAESHSSRRGSAKVIYYAWGDGNSNELQQVINKMGYQGVAIHIKELFDAFVNGVKLFKNDLSNSIEKAQLVYKRADKFFINIRDIPYKIPSDYYVP